MTPWSPLVYFTCARCGKQTFCAKDAGRRGRDGALECRRCSRRKGTK